MTLLLPISALLLCVASLSLITGYSVLRMHMKSNLNWLFALGCLCLTLWALGLSVIIVAPDEATCIFWKRISASGSQMLFSILVHFTLMLTGHERLLRRRWVLALIYAPAVFFEYVFAFSTSQAIARYQFISSPAGWLLQRSNTAMDISFIVYILCCVTLSVVLLARWKRKNPGDNIARQTKLIIGAYVITLVLGAFTDVVNATANLILLPQIAPVFCVIPLLAYAWCIYRYHFLRPANPDISEQILTDAHSSRFLPILSIGFIAVGAAFLALEFYWWRPEQSWLAWVPAVLLVALGIPLALFRKRRTGRSLELVLVVLNTVIVPLQTVSMIEYGGTTTWAFTLVLLICALVLNSRIVLVSTATAMLLNQFYLWGVTPMVMVSVGAGSYLGRIMTIVTATVAAAFVHHVFVARLRENAEQMRMQQLLGSVASVFYNVDEENVQSRIRALLAELAHFFHAQSAVYAPLQQEWAERIPAQCVSAENTMLSADAAAHCLTRWRLDSQPGARIHRAFEQPDQQDSSVPEVHADVAATPWIHLPVFAGGEAVGVIQLESTTPSRLWNTDKRLTMRLVSRLVSDALERLQAENHIRFMAYYDNLTRLPNRQLFLDRAEQGIQLAGRNGGLVAILFLDMDGFKAVNDTLGHEAGDQLLQEVANAISASLRKSDTVARFGGDEFLILLNGIHTPEDVTVAAKKLIQLFTTPFTVLDRQIAVTASVGVAVYPTDGETADTLIHRADHAMYSAKRQGKNRYALYADTETKD